MSIKFWQNTWSYILARSVSCGFIDSWMERESPPAWKLPILFLQGIELPIDNQNTRDLYPTLFNLETKIHPSILFPTTQEVAGQCKENNIFSSYDHKRSLKQERFEIVKIEVSILAEKELRNICMTTSLSRGNILYILCAERKLENLTRMQCTLHPRVRQSHVLQKHVWKFVKNVIG